MSSSSSLNSLLSSTSGTSSSSLDLSSLLAAATGSTSTGIDVTSAVDAAIYAARAPERQWQTQQSTIQSQMTALTSIQTAALNLSADLDTLNDPLGALAARAVTSSNSAAVTASAAAGTAVGTHTVSVSSLAAAASWYSPAVAGTNSSMGSSELTITKADGTQTSFSLADSANNSLTSLVASINSASLGVTASIVQDASGFRLALVGTTTGAAADFSATEGPATSTAWSSAQVASPSTQLNATSFDVNDGTSSATISVVAGSTFADVASQINAQGLNVTASVVADGSGAHLSITSNAGGTVTVSADPALALTRANYASNASLTVDGVPITSASNTVTGALSGITLNLAAITAAGQVSLGVTPDATRINSEVTQFVNDYNSTISSVSSQFTFNTSTSSEGVLGSDSSLRSFQSMLLGISGYTNSISGSVSALSSLGITMNNDGTLTLDTAVLDQAITRNPSSLQTFFQGTSANGFAGKIKADLDTYTRPNVGVLAVDINSLTRQYNDLQSSVDEYESGYIASQQTLLTSMYSKAEIALQSLPSTLKELQSQLGQNSGG